MKDAETIEVDLCSTCRREPYCLPKGIFGRQTCMDYEEMSIGELLERDRLIRAIMVGSCPRCDSENTHDCENNSILEDVTIGHCLDCELYWCLECGYLFDEVEKGSQCPHYTICQECSEQHGYLDGDEFIERICPMCKHYNDGCLLDDNSKCEKEDEYLCPYEANISECSRIKQFIEEQD